MYVSFFLWFWGLNPYPQQVSTVAVSYVPSLSEKFPTYLISICDAILYQPLDCSLEYGFESLIIIVLRVTFKK